MDTHVLQTYRSSSSPQQDRICRRHSPWSTQSSSQAQNLPMLQSPLERITSFTEEVNAFLYFYNTALTNSFAFAIIVYALDHRLSCRSSCHSSPGTRPLCGPPSERTCCLRLPQNLKKDWSSIINTGIKVIHFCMEWQRKHWRQTVVKPKYGASKYFLPSCLPSPENNHICHHM